MKLDAYYEEHAQLNNILRDEVSAKLLKGAFERASIIHVVPEIGIGRSGMIEPTDQGLIIKCEYNSPKKKDDPFVLERTLSIEIDVSSIRKVFGEPAIGTPSYPLRYLFSNQLFIESFLKYYKKLKPHSLEKTAFDKILPPEIKVLLEVK